jgi:hypothetical protein
MSTRLNSCPAPAAQSSPGEGKVPGARLPEAPKRVDPRIGLSNCHIPQNGALEPSDSPGRATCGPYCPGLVHYLTLARGADYVEVKTRHWHTPQERTHTRGSCVGLSERSRRRLIRKLAQLNERAQSYRPLFVTLTYPAHWPEDWHAWKRHLERFCRALLYRWPLACVIWRLEYQDRGAPHFHLIVLGVDFIHFSWVAQKWVKATQTSSKEHLAAGTETRRARSWGETRSYAAKYVAKQTPQQFDGPAGRHWGIYGRENLPIYLSTVRLPRWVWLALRDELAGDLPGPRFGDPNPGRAPFAGLWVARPVESIRWAWDQRLDITKGAGDGR